MEDLGYRVTELERRLANVLAIGVITAVDYPAGRVRVRIGDLITSWLPWFTARAGGDRSWHAPELGEQVMVLSPSGEPGQGVVLPAIYQTAAPAPAEEVTVATMVFEDGARITYDRAAHHLEADLPASGTARLIADGGVTIVGDVSIDGSIDLTGQVTAGNDVVAAGVSLITHTHTDVEPGGGNSGPPNAS